jgi:hypothetical protein
MTAAQDKLQQPLNPLVSKGVNIEGALEAKINIGQEFERGEKLRVLFF